MSTLFVYEAFVSYNHRDKRWTKEFVSLLRSCGVSTFFDDDAIAFGESIPKQVATGLSKSRVILILISKNSVKSKWVSAELYRKFMKDPDGSGQSVIPVLLEYVDLSSEIPLLDSLKYVDLTDPDHRQAQFEALLTQLGVRALSLPQLPIYKRDTQAKQDAPKQRTDRQHSKPNAQSNKRHKLAIVGVGYVGSAIAASLISVGHSIYAIEKDPLKLDSLQRGRSHLYEPGVDEIFSIGYQKKILSADASLPSDRSNISAIVITIGPSLKQDESTKRWDASHFFVVLAEIGEAIRSWASFEPIPIIITATLQPSDCRRALSTLEEAIGSPHGTKFFLAMCPLFLREGSMLSDFRDPPFTILGTPDGQSNNATIIWNSLLKELIHAKLTKEPQDLLMRMEAACLLKLSSNAFHALKVAFANEIGRVCRAAGVSATNVMEAFARDQSLNISSAYLVPGFAFGGSCLKKDIHALLSTVDQGVATNLTLLSAIQDSNTSHLRHCAQKVQRHADQLKLRKVGVFGLTFKPGTDDLRDSQSLELIGSLPRSFEILATDPDLLRTSNLTGANRAHWQETLATAKVQLAADPVDIVRACKILIIAKRNSFPFLTVGRELTADHFIIDLVGETELFKELPCRVETIM